MMNKSNILKSDMERKGYKFRLNVPNGEVSNKLARIAGSCRFVWNKALALVKADDESYRAKIEELNCGARSNTEIQQVSRVFKFNPYSQLSAMLPQWKQEPQTAFLADAYSKSLQITLEELGQAIVEAKSKTNPKQYPVFKKRGVKDSFSFNGAIKHDAANGRIFIPKLGYIGYAKSREVLGIIKNVTISKQADKWYVSLQTERPLSHINPSLADADKIIGIDVGVAKAVSASDNISFEYQGKQIDSNQLDSVNPLKQHQTKLAKLQKDLSRKTKFSRNWYKLKAKISKLHTRISNIRKDFVHKATTAITKSYAYVAVEALKIKNMSKSAKGNLHNPGKKVKQKSGLNRSILDQGWGMFRQFLSYKLKYNYGTTLIEVNPRHTSQRCSGCGHTDTRNRKSQANFQCVVCGFTMNADLNAALNIRTAGLAGDTRNSVLACGVSSIGAGVVSALARYGTLKQEPTELSTEICCI